MARFRCSSHPLHIEKGRHSKTALEDRICNYCMKMFKSVLLEDEYHFLCACPLYNDLRKQLLPEYLFTASQDIFIEYMSLSTDINIKNLAIYINSAFKLRESYDQQCVACV